MTRIGDDYIALASVACAICEDTKERLFKVTAQQMAHGAEVPGGVRNATANDCPPGEGRIPREPAPNVER